MTKEGGSFGTVSLQEFRSGGWVINRQDLDIKEVIGRGDFGGESSGIIEFSSVWVVSSLVSREVRGGGRGGLNSSVGSVLGSLSSVM